jgi:hypothetical protein
MNGDALGAFGFAAVLGWLGTLTVAHVHAVRAGAFSWRALAFVAALVVGGAALEWRHLDMEGLRLLALGAVAGAAGALIPTFHKVGR